MTPLLSVLLAAGIGLSLWAGAKVVHAVAHPKQTVHKILHHAKKTTP
jgi:hypothetical protein